MRRASLSLALLLGFACSSLHLQEVQDVDMLYFGTARPGGVVSDAEWKTFVDEVITPAYPGFTEWNAIGHWRGAEEAAHVVLVVHLSRRGNDERIIRIIREYKRRFQQESVLWIRSRGLVAPE
ncbi:MAG: DUF3574 domain-containing protein [Thermoanaerobaculia bacterium]